jgi:hypothetical protein
MNLIVMAATAPFGWIGGLLSDISRTLPFILNLVLLALGFCITVVYYKLNPRLTDVHDEPVAVE